MMNVIDLLRTGYYSRRNRLYRVIPIRFAYVYMKVWVVAAILIIVCTYPFPNRKYYKLGINGKVEKMERVYKDWHLKIGTNWYLVNRRGMQYVQPGHIIVKKPFSWIFTVSDSLGNTVYQDSVRSLTFRLKD